MNPMDVAVKNLETVTAFYARDLAAMTEEQIVSSAGGVARTPADFTYETALINRRIAARLRGTDPPAMPNTEGFVVAPTEYQSKQAICDYFSTSCQDLVEAAKAVPEAEIGKLVGPPGREEPAYAFVFFAAMHTNYHDAQLNYIQTLSGDMAMHWF